MSPAEDENPRSAGRQSHYGPNPLRSAMITELFTNFLDGIDATTREVAAIPEIKRPLVPRSAPGADLRVQPVAHQSRAGAATTGTWPR